MHKLASQINIIEQLNGQNIKWQNQEIEVERLKTTCKTLQSKVVLSQDYKNNLESLQRQLDWLKKSQQSKDTEIKVLQKENAALEEKNRALQQQTITLTTENNKLREDLESVITGKQDMQTELEQCTDYMISLEEKVYKSNKISLELLSQLKNAQLEIEQLH